MPTEKYRLSNGTWTAYYGPQGSSLPNQAKKPVGSFTVVSPADGVWNRVNVDASASTDADGTIVKYSWDFQQSTYETTNPVATGYIYNSAGVYTITLRVTDDSGLVSDPVSKQIIVNAQNTAPSVTFTTTTRTDNVTIDATATTSDSDGYVAKLDWNWGDTTAHTVVNGTASGIVKTASHTYASSGPFTITLIATDDDGLTTQVTGIVNPSTGSTGGGGTTGGNATVSPWKTGSPTEGMSASAPVYKASTLAQTGSQMELQSLINAMPGNGYIDISNEQVFISSFNSGTYFNGASGSRFYGLIGGISNGTFNNQVTLRAGALSAALVSQVQANQSGTSMGAVIRPSPAQNGGTALPIYMMGVHFVGADQGKVNENSTAQFTPSPARMKGLDLDVGPNGSIVQNCLLEGWGAADGNTPPWEVGSIDFRRTNGQLMRRVEVSGILPVGSPSRLNASVADPYGHNWKRTGGIQFNADKNPKLVNVSLHDTLVSGLTFSIAGTSNNGTNNTENISMDGCYLANNSLKGFSGTNLENTLGSHLFNNCTFIMNGTGGQYIKLNPRLSGTSPNVTNFKVTEPTWSGLAYNGMFAIGIANWGSTQTTAPTVIKNGRSLTPVTTDSGTATNNYRIVPL